MNFYISVLAKGACSPLWLMFVAMMCRVIFRLTLISLKHNYSPSHNKYMFKRHCPQVQTIQSPVMRCCSAHDTRHCRRVYSAAIAARHRTSPEPRQSRPAVPARTTQTAVLLAQRRAQTAAAPSQSLLTLAAAVLVPVTVTVTVPVSVTVTATVTALMRPVRSSQPVQRAVCCGSRRMQMPRWSARTQTAEPRVRAPTRPSALQAYNYSDLKTN